MPRFPLTGKSKRSLAAGWMWVKCGQSPLHESPGSSFGPAGDDWTRAKDQATPLEVFYVPSPWPPAFRSSVLTIINFKKITFLTPGQRVLTSFRGLLSKSLF